MSLLPALLIAVCVAAGFFYAAFGVVVMVLGLGWAARLWSLELLVAALVAWWSYAWCSRLVERQGQGSPGSAERVIWRLAYRQGMVLGVEQIARETMLDQAGALSILQELERKGLARPERVPSGETCWHLLGPGRVGISSASK